MNGEVQTYRLNDKMEWGEFKKLPQDIKREYITKLVRTNGARAIDIAEMFGVSNGYLCKYLKEELPDLNLFASTGPHKPTPQWLEFIGKNELGDVDASEEPLELVKPINAEEVQSELAYEVKSCKLNYVGTPAVIFQKALLALDPSVRYSIEIKAYPEDDDDF